MRAGAILLVLCIGCSGPEDVAVLRTGERAVVFGEHLLLGVRGGDTEVEVVFAYDAAGVALEIPAHGPTLLIGDGPNCAVVGWAEGDFSTAAARTSTRPFAQDCSIVPALRCTAHCSAVSVRWNLAEPTGLLR